MNKDKNRTSNCSKYHTTSYFPWYIKSDIDLLFVHVASIWRHVNIWYDPLHSYIKAIDNDDPLCIISIVRKYTHYIYIYIIHLQFFLSFTKITAITFHSCVVHSTDEKYKLSFKVCRRLAKWVIFLFLHFSFIEMLRI